MSNDCFLKSPFQQVLSIPLPSFDTILHVFVGHPNLKLIFGTLWEPPKTYPRSETCQKGFTKVKHKHHFTHKVCSIFSTNELNLEQICWWGIPSESKHPNPFNLVTHLLNMKFCLNVLVILCNPCM